MDWLMTFMPGIAIFVVVLLVPGPSDLRIAKSCPGLGINALLVFLVYYAFINAALDLAYMFRPGLLEPGGRFLPELLPGAVIFTAGWAGGVALRRRFRPDS